MARRTVSALIAAVALAVTLLLVRGLSFGGPDASVSEIDTYLRLRALPSVTSDIRAELAPRTPLDVVGRSADGSWLAVITPDERGGWVAREYVDLNINLNALRVSDGQTVIVPEPQIAPEVAAHVREIAARGAALGRDPHSFSKVGDSITAAPHMLTPIARDLLTLGDFEALAEVVNHYTKDAFGADSLAARSGWASTEVLKPELVADNPLCEADETPLACEYRVRNPSVALIMFGTNDVSILTADAYRAYMTRIIEETVSAGIVPVISTIPTRAGFEDKVSEFNVVIRELAAEYRVPLWQYGAAMHFLPNSGLSGDGVHPSLPYLGLDGVTDFRTENLISGYVIRNLGALQMLDAVRTASGI
jgi:hypothetical protein